MEAYDDATGLIVRAPKGNVTWGRGYELAKCGSAGLFDVMDRYLIGQLDMQMQAYDWYRTAGDVRGSVFLDVAYNSGLHGLLAFPSMLHYASINDWPNASAQCSVVKTDPKLDASRYAPLRALLLSG